MAGPAPQPYRLRPVRIACINQSTVPLGVPFDKLTAALQTFYDRCFLPVWGYPVQLYMPGARPAPGDWEFYYIDDADEAKALGYHELTRDRQAISKVWLKATPRARELLSGAACHELCEMVLEPLVTLWAEAADGMQW